MAIENLQANKGIFYKVLSKITKKDYYKAPTGATIKTDKGKGSVSYDTNTGEITCEGLQNAIIKGTSKADKINVQNSKNVKVAGGLGDDEFTIKYSDTVQINGGLGKDEVKIYDNNPKNIKMTGVERQTPSGNGVIENSKQGRIGDCWFLSEINAMSYTETGRKIIKESILWDNENQQAIVHCKGLGFDMTVSYDELQNARENGNQYYNLDEYQGDNYSTGDDDMFLLEYVMTKLFYLKENGLIDFENISNSLSPIEFLAGAENQVDYNADEAYIKEILDQLDADGGKNLCAKISTKTHKHSLVLDSKFKLSIVATNHAYAIKEVKDGYVTVINPWNSSDKSPFAQKFTYDDFCKYFDITEFADLSQTSDITPELIVHDGVKLSDYGITMTSGVAHICELKLSDEKVIDESNLKEGITFSANGVGPYSIYKSTRESASVNLGGEITNFSQTLDMAKNSLNKKDKLNAFKFKDKDGLVHLFVNNNGTIRYFTGDGIKNYNYKFVEEKEMTVDEFKSYIISVIDKQEYVQGYNVYSD